MDVNEAKRIVLDMLDAYRHLRTMEDVYLDRKYVLGSYVKITEEEYLDPLESGIQDLRMVITCDGVTSDENGGQEGLYAVMTGLVELCQKRLLKCRDTFLDLMIDESEDAKEWREFAKKKVWEGNMGVFQDQFHTSFEEVRVMFDEIQERVEGGF